MAYRLKIVQKNDDFAKIEKDGFGGVIFAEKLVCEDSLRKARNCRLKIFLHIGDFSRLSCSYLEPDGAVCGEIYAVTSDTVGEKAAKLKEFMPFIDGFVIPAPKLKGLLWQENFSTEYEDFSGRDFREDMPSIFDRYAEIADIRMWYYMRAAEVMFQKYISPFMPLEKSLEKKICFDFGSAPDGMALIKKLLSPYMFLNNKVTVIYENDGEIILVSEKSRTKEVLLVLPVCSVMRFMAWNAPYSRMESPLSIAVEEEEYYKTMLKRCGIQFCVIDEHEFSEMKKKELEKFENILICDSCTIADTDRLKGLNVNNEKLLELFDKGN